LCEERSKFQVDLCFACSQGFVAQGFGRFDLGIGMAGPSVFAPGGFKPGFVQRTGKQPLPAGTAWRGQDDFELLSNVDENGFGVGRPNPERANERQKKDQQESHRFIA